MKRAMLASILGLLFLSGAGGCCCSSCCCPCGIGPCGIGMNHALKKHGYCPECGHKCSRCSHCGNHGHCDHCGHCGHCGRGHCGDECGHGGRMGRHCRNGGAGMEDQFDDGNPSAQVTYPYYTTRGPRDFLAPNPRGIGR